MQTRGVKRFGSEVEKAMAAAIGAKHGGVSI